MPNHKLSKNSVQGEYIKLKLATFTTHHTLLYLINLITSGQE